MGTLYGVHVCLMIAEVTVEMESLSTWNIAIERSEKATLPLFALGILFLATLLLSTFMDKTNAAMQSEN